MVVVMVVMMMGVVVDFDYNLSRLVSSLQAELPASRFGVTWRFHATARR